MAKRLLPVNASSGKWLPIAKKKVRQLTPSHPKSDLSKCISAGSGLKNPQAHTLCARHKNPAAR